jgi:transcriptional regulator with XRE-family HTH domain
MEPSMNKLEQYCKARKWGPGDLAKRLGVHRNSVDRYLRGERRPSWEVLERLKVLTKGKIKADDFLPEKLKAAE